MNDIILYEVLGLYIWTNQRTKSIGLRGDFYDMRSDISFVVIRLTYYLHKLKSFHRSNTDVNLTQFFGGGGSFTKG